jgi:zinc protease
MRSLTLAPEEFAKEIKVVMEERRLRTEDDPESLTYEIAAATAFQTSPYRRPVIGWMSDLERMTVADLRDWYQRYYAPNNATLVVAGDVNGEEVHALAQQHFGPLKPSTIEPNKPTAEVPQRGLKRVTVRAPAKLPYLLMAYKVPALTGAIADPKRVPESEIYALDVLSGVLDAGESARLSRNLVRGKQIAASASAGYDALDRLDTLFTFNGTPAQGQTIAKLEEALRAEIKALQEKPVEPAELERIKTQVVTSDIYQKDSVFYQAMEVGGLVTVGLDWKLKDQYVDKIKAVTAEQVQAVARKYLIDDNLTIAHLDPLPLKPGQHLGQGGASAHVR